MDRNSNGRDKIIGIDLGTTYTCVGVWQHGRVEIIANDQGNRITPSMVAFTPNERLVGDGSKFQIATNPINTVFDTKRLIGRRYDDPSVQSDKKLWPFTIVCGNNDKPLIEVTYKGEKKLFAAEEISSMVLAKVKTIAEDYLQCNVKNAVITVPAYFNDSQRRATKDAGKIAGLNVMRIINEPTAAAINYGFLARDNRKRNILVFDLGGGTFDVSISTAERGKHTVKSVGGDMHLGGEDFDNRLLNYCVQRFKTQYRLDMSTCPKTLTRLRSQCERAKRSLSSSLETAIDIDCLYEGQDFHTKIRRAKFEELNADLFGKCMQIVKRCLKDSKLSKDQIDDIVLVGGSSRIPKLQELLSQFFDGKELCKSVNPDEAVAHGAALQAAAMNKEEINLVLEDVTPLSLGVEVEGGVMEVIVPRNTPIPTLKEISGTTVYDNQLGVDFAIYEGERPLTTQNNLLGEFVLNGIQRARAEVPEIRLCFHVDEEGILTASARDIGTGVNNQFTVTNERERLNKEEIDRMVADAEMFRKQDEEMVKKRVAKNTLDSYVYNMKSRMTEAKSKGTMKRRDADDITRALNTVEEWLDENDSATVEELEAKFNELSLKCSCLT